MEKFIATATDFLGWLQMPSLILTAIAICVGGYFFMWGGDQGRQQAKKWWIGAVVGLVVVMGAYSLATSVNNNLNF